MMQKTIEPEVTIIGNGLTGSFFAIALSHFTNIKFVIIDDSKNNTISNNFDGRTLLITHKSKKIFEELGVWDWLSNYACKINGVKVFEHSTPFFVDYNKFELGTTEFGYIVEYDAVLNALRNFKNFEIINDKVSSVVPNKESILINLESKRSINSDLCVSAEGMNGKTYLSTEITKQINDYDHIALVAHIKHFIDHKNYAYEVFDENGFLAILPMKRNCDEDFYNSSIVMSFERGQNADKIQDKEYIENLINEKFTFYGDLSVCSKIWAYPLRSLKSSKVYSNRYVSIGDSANVLHPLGGLGINLGWADCFILAKHISNFHKIGVDIGTNLDLYAKKRALSHKMHHFGINSILKTFKSSYLKSTRRFGLSILQRIPYLKKQIMKIISL